MSYQQLWETTMNPETRSMYPRRDEGRHCRRRAVHAADGDKVEPRKEFIEENAKLVADLDI